jgi:hypothetical protein
MISNRVNQLVELWGHEKGLEIAISNHHRAHAQGSWVEAERWLKEVQAYRKGKLIVFRPSDEVAFRPQGPAKVLEFR